MGNESGRIYRQRAHVLNLARDLARSGLHVDHSTIVRELEAMEGFAAARPRLAERAIRSQLDRLCMMAQQGRGEQVAQATRRP